MKILSFSLFTVYEFFRDKVFYSVLIFSVLFVLFAYLLSSLTIVESKKILLDFGFSAISIVGIITAIFLGISIIGKEIEKKIIYTILSKPVSRFDYLIGKISGGIVVLGITHIISSFTLLLTLWINDESISNGFLSANILMYLESILILLYAVFFSTWISSNFLSASLAAAIFLLGRSSSTIESIQLRMEASSMKSLLSVVFYLAPSLNRFNIRDLVAYEKELPPMILQQSTIYFFAYSMLLVTLTILIFRKKDFI
ncbi:MAG: ABC transporter permease [Oligoflexia bacterium]|nr:ABC transporter permease [Oligoflexia bacterium]